MARAGEEVKQRAKDTVSAAKQQASDAISSIKGPDKMERLKQMVINRLPYHPQFLRKGTVYSAELLSPMMFGPATPTTARAARDEAGTLEHPERAARHLARFGEDASRNAPRGGRDRAGVF